MTIIQLSRPTSKPLQVMADAYSSLWPIFGEILVGSRRPHRHLVDWIEMHPDQETFESMMQDACYVRVSHEIRLGGIAALHIGLKPQAWLLVTETMTCLGKLFRVVDALTGC